MLSRSASGHTSGQPSARTRVAAVIGDPVSHSLSPALHNAAFAALGLDWVYVAFAVAAGRAAEAVEAMRTLRLAGLSVTMPHKAGVAAAVDRLAPVARRLGVVNTVSWSRWPEDGGELAGGEGPAEGAELVGESTDGAGFVDALRSGSGSGAGFDPAGRRCLVLGAGGAARAVTHSLAEAGAAEVTVIARRDTQASACAELAGPAGRVGRPSGAAGEVARAELVVNATPVGMRPGDGMPLGVDPAWMRADLWVADLIYSPDTTPLLAAARGVGAGCTNGLGMLVHQAARQVELWTGRPAPVAEMAAAAAVAAATPGGPNE